MENRRVHYFRRKINAEEAVKYADEIESKFIGEFVSTQANQSASKRSESRVSADSSDEEVAKPFVSDVILHTQDQPLKATELFV